MFVWPWDNLPAEEPDRATVIERRPDVELDSPSRCALELEIAAETGPPCRWFMRIDGRHIITSETALQRLWIPETSDGELPGLPDA